jgi:HSP20 family molecular chaperone IbpA
LARRSELGELFDRFEQAWPMALEDFGRTWHWRLDIEDKEDGMVIHAEAPGFEAGAFDLRMSGDRLTLHASRRAETKMIQG